MGKLGYTCLERIEEGTGEEEGKRGGESKGDQRRGE